MAEKTPKLIKLTPTEVKELQGLEGEIKEAEEAIERFKKIGMNTVEIEAKLTLAKTQREMLLKYFS